MTDHDDPERPDTDAILASVETARRQVFSAWLATRDDARFFAGTPRDEATAPAPAGDPATTAADPRD